MTQYLQHQAEDGDSVAGAVQCTICAWCLLLLLPHLCRRSVPRCPGGSSPVYISSWLMGLIYASATISEQRSIVSCGAKTWQQYQGRCSGKRAHGALTCHVWYHHFCVIFMQHALTRKLANEDMYVATRSMSGTRRVTRVPAAACQSITPKMNTYAEARVAPCPSLPLWLVATTGEFRSDLCQTSGK